MILNDKQILNKMQTGEIKIKPLPKPIQIQPASIDLTLGTEYYQQFPNQDIDVKTGNPSVRMLKGDRITIPAQAFILATTNEYIKLPKNLIGRVEGRSSVGRLGLTVHVTAGFIDAGFEGNITLEIANLSQNNITLHKDMRICQIVFEEIETPCRTYGECDNKYQGQTGVTNSMIYYDGDNG